MGKFTEKEKAWIKEYFKADGNATEATRIVYGETAGACRVKGHKKKLKFQRILQEIEARGFDRMEYNGVTGIDFYLGNLEESWQTGLTLFSDKQRQNNKMGG